MTFLHFSPAGVDYKLLMSGKGDPLSLLLPALSASNIHVVTKLASKIPSSTNTRLTPGVLFCAFSLKLFSHGSDKSPLKASKVCDVCSGENLKVIRCNPLQVNWDDRFDSCQEYLNLLTASELHHFVLGIALCEKSLKVCLALNAVLQPIVL